MLKYFRLTAKISRLALWAYTFYTGLIFGSNWDTTFNGSIKGTTYTGEIALVPIADFVTIIVLANIAAWALGKFTRWCDTSTPENRTQPIRAVVQPVRAFAADCKLASKSIWKERPWK